MDQSSQSETLPDAQPAQTSYQPEQRVAWANPPKQRKRSCCGGCFLGLFVPLALLIGALALYLFFPGRSNILIFGIDSRDPASLLGRTDTLMLSTFDPWPPYIGLLSIPRDLWVTIPNYGEDRINTAYFYAEAEQPGSGPQAIMQAVRTNFGVDVDYFIRIRFIGLLSLIDAMGSLQIELPEAMSGYPAGTHELTPELALALVRDRAGSDDFSRMQRGQLFVKAVLKSLLSPNNISQYPQVIAALSEFIETDVPFWLWPRFGVGLLRLGPDGIDSRIITREMTTPFTTSGGAQVLAPNWELINPVLFEMFGQ